MMAMQILTRTGLCAFAVLYCPPDWSNREGQDFLQHTRTPGVDMAVIHMVPWRAGGKGGGLFLLIHGHIF